MSVGLTLTKADIDQRAAGIVIALRDSLRRASEFCALLNDTSIIANDAALTTIGYSGPGAGTDITYLRNAFTDLGGTGVSLYRVATGAVAGPGSPNDFFFNAKHLTGVITS
jgi:hypothetical protein